MNSNILWPCIVKKLQSFFIFLNPSFEKIIQWNSLKLTPNTYYSFTLCKFQFDMDCNFWFIINQLCQMFSRLWFLGSVWNCDLNLCLNYKIIRGGGLQFQAPICMSWALVIAEPCLIDNFASFLHMYLDCFLYFYIF